MALNAPKHFGIFPPDWGILRRSRCIHIFLETDSDISAVVRYFEYCFQKPIAAPRWTPAGAAPLFYTPRSSDT